MTRGMLDIDKIVEQVLQELNTERSTIGKLAILKVADKLAFVYSASDATLDRIAAMIRGLGFSYPFDRRQTDRSRVVSTKVLRLTPRLRIVETKK